MLVETRKDRGPGFGNLYPPEPETTGRTFGL